MRQVIIVLIVLSAFALSGAAHDYFPLSIGSWWEYEGEELDSLGNPIPGLSYNTTSTIVGDTLINNNTYYISHASHFLNEVNYMRSEGDTLKMILQMWDQVTWVEADMCILPNPVGYTWQALDTIISEIGDSMEISTAMNGEVIDFGAWTVPGGTFSDTYQLRLDFYVELTIYEPYWSIIAEGFQDVWLSFGIGGLEFFQPASTFMGQSSFGYSEKLLDYEVVAVEPYDIKLQPVSFSLEAPYPNPFNPVTTMTFSLPALTEVIVDVYNLNGSLVRRMNEGQQPPGIHKLIFDAAGLPSGIYFLNFRAGEFRDVRKVVLQK